MANNSKLNPKTIFTIITLIVVATMYAVDYFYPNMQTGIVFLSILILLSVVAIVMFISKAAK